MRTLVATAWLASGLPSDAMAQQAAAHGWVRIFDGRSPAGWRGAAQYAIDDSALVLRGGRPADALCTEQPLGDFVLRFRARPSHGESDAEVVLRARQAREGRSAAGPAAMVTPGKSAALDQDRAPGWANRSSRRT